MRHRSHMPTQNGESGQVLILAMLAVIIILVAVLCLFDVQSVIRGKIKSRTGVDAAALAAADWQRHSLNMIGELNLVKACTILVSDIEPFDDDSAEGIRISNDLLTEAQVRISFVGPMIGLGAAQQAAKNNGLNYNEGYCGVVRGHLARLEDDGFYGEGMVDQDVRGYEWRTPYSQMVDMVYADGKGIAVAPNTSFQGIPRLVGDSPFIWYLQQRWVYEAISANYWCALRFILRMDYGPPGFKWWGDIELAENTAAFPEQSEYLTVHVDFAGGTGVYRQAASRDGFATLVTERGLTLLEDAYDPFEPGSPNDTDGKINPLPLLTWAVYGPQWSPYGADVRSIWGDYLRSDIRTQYAYYGAVAKMTAEVQPQTLLGDWNSGTDEDDRFLGDALNISGKRIDGHSFSEHARRLRNAERQMKYGLDMIRASSLAKPLGSLPGDEEMPPNMVAMMLPVFTKSALIPVALEEPNSELDPFDYRWFAFVTEYLPALGTVSRIADMGPDRVPDPSHWPWFVPYHNALLKWDDPTWRQMGIDWLETTIESYTDPITNVTVPTRTNEDTCDDWAGGGTGPRYGPPVLH